VPTLVMHGSKSPQGMADGSTALAAMLGGAEHQVLSGQTHIVTPRVVAPALREFFAVHADPSGRNTRDALAAA
jgi:hypothetical protein